MGLGGIRTLSLGGNGSGGMQGLPKYATFALLPVTATNGDVAITLDTDTIYVYNGVAWFPVSGTNMPLDVQDTSSIDLNIQSPGVSNILTAALLISPIGATAGFLKIDSSVDIGISPGLLGQFQAYPVYEKTSSVLQILGVTTQIPGSSLSIQVNQASGTTSGYLSFTDWNTFNNKVSNIGPFSYVSFAQGATIFGPTFQLGAADVTNPGGVGTTTQTFAGFKLFQDNILSPIHYGSTAATGKLSLLSTSNATQGAITLGDIVGSSSLLGIRMANPQAAIHFSAGVTNTTSGTIGQHSVVLGRINTSNNVGIGAFLIGGQNGVNTASGQDSFAGGAGGRAEASFAFAWHSISQALASVAMGDGAQVTSASDRAISIGPGNVTSGQRASSFGNNTIAQGYAQTVVGEFNVAQGTGAARVLADSVFIVGNGSAAGSRSNVFEITRNNYFKYYGSSAGFISMIAGTSLAGYTLMWPNIQGSTNSFLQNDGLGNLAWSTSALTVGPFSYTSFAQGATVFGPTFQLGWADATNPGAVGTTHQTFAGNKTFLGFAQTPLLNLSGASSGILQHGVGTSFIGYSLIWPGLQGATNSFLQNNGVGGLTWTISTSGFGQTNALLLFGASSGTFTASVGNSFASFSNVLPLAQGITGSVLTNDGAGNLSWATSLAPNYQVSSSSSTFSTSSGSYTDVTNLTVTLTTSGNPVILKLIPDGSGNVANLDCKNNTGVQSADMDINFVEGSTVIAENNHRWASSGLVAVSALDVICPVSAHNHSYQPAAGTYTYKVQIRNNGGGGTSAAQVNYAKLVAYELSSNPVVLPTTLAVTARASTDAGQTINGSLATVNFEDVTFDSAGGITTGASWTYTCQAGMGGVYLVNVGLVCNQASGSGSTTADAVLRKNGSTYSELSFWSANDTDPFIYMYGSDLITLVPGDTIDVQARNSAYTVTLVAGGGIYNHITIHKVG